MKKCRIFALLLAVVMISTVACNAAETDTWEMKLPTMERLETSQIENKYQNLGEIFELPINGATGWAAIDIPLLSEPNTASQPIFALSAGTAFTILLEQEEWWYVRLGGADALGWVRHNSCFINLPDVIPSIAYNINNAYSSELRSLGLDIPNITGRQLYSAHGYNQRLDRDEFIVPALYSSSKLLGKAQRAALAQGDVIIMHEAFRPRATQRNIVQNMETLLASNDDVRKALTTPPWELSWFVHTGISNHQLGVAFDVSLGRVISQEIKTVGGIDYTAVTYELYDMPTVIHELSPSSSIFQSTFIIESRYEWREVPFADTATDGTLRLIDYFDSAGFTPLASEWWHFNDLDGMKSANEIGIMGDFFTETTYSTENSD